MRRLLALTSLAALVLLFVGHATWSQTEFTQEQLDGWQAVAESYYAEGVDENAMLPLLDDPTLRDNRWGFEDGSQIQPGMIAPNFTLLDIYDTPVSLSQFNGNTFIVLVTGSWY